MNKTDPKGKPKKPAKAEGELSEAELAKVSGAGRPIAPGGGRGRPIAPGGGRGRPIAPGGGRGQTGGDND